MREPENIHAVEELGVDMVGLVFCPGDERYVSMLPSHAGIIPDHARKDIAVGVGNAKCYVPRVGVFADDMPQNIITRIYNYNLDYVQLNGEESFVMIDNLRSSVDPDIHLGIKVIKTIKVACVDDMAKCAEYEGHADLLMFSLQSSADNVSGTNRCFDWSLLEAYEGNIPFLVEGKIGMEDIGNIKKIKHPMFAGVDLDTEFETSSGIKDIDKLASFVRQLR